jgi:hypothetical protein
MISLRFYWFPKTFKASFLHPTESLFIPAAVISFGTILINISQYGVGKTGDWLEQVSNKIHPVRVIHWQSSNQLHKFPDYVCVILVRLRSRHLIFNRHLSNHVSPHHPYSRQHFTGTPRVLTPRVPPRWSTQTFTISQMTPVWIFPAYPLLIIGPHAGNLAPKLSNPGTALSVIISGYVIQGIGFLVSLST